MSKRENNQTYSAPNHLNRRIYWMGINGSYVALIFLAIIGVSLVISFSLNLPILIVPIAGILLVIVKAFLKKYEKRYKETGLDDPLDRELEEGKFYKAYRDNDGFLNKI